MANRRACRALAGALFVMAAARAQPPAAPGSADYARAEQYMPYGTAGLVLHTVQNATWLPDGRLWYRTMSATGSDFIVLDPSGWVQRPLFDREKIARALSVAARATFDPTHLPFATLDLSADGATMSFEAAARHWSCDLRGERCAESPAANPDESASPDGARVAFVRDYNLWVRERASGRETQLTTDGVRHFGYATDNPGWQHSNRAIVLWSPDSKQLATFQQDERAVAEAHLISMAPGHPGSDSWKYAMAGDEAIATIERVIIDVDARRVVRLQIAPDAHRSSACYDVQCGDGVFADAQWSPDGSQLAFVSTSRDHKRARVRLADAASGSVREVLEEQAATYYESDLSSDTHTAVNWRFLPRSRELIWYSQRDNWGHLYLYDLQSGHLKHQITSGEWNVRELLRVDEKARSAYFLGVGRERGRDPYFLHLYKVGLDDGRISLLTPEDANHEVVLSPTADVFIDTYSRPEVPSVSALRHLGGRTLRILERADWAPLLGIGWKPPQPITVKARDGATDLYGLMWRPTNFDPARRYPIIDWVYPGPQIGSVGSRSFSASRGDRQSLAELGFIVVAIDGMGTSLRSKRFQDVSYGNMIDATLPDQVAAMRQLAQREPAIDIDRAGIYGHSGGGYAAAAAMFNYADFFKVGIAESGNHDQRGYTDDWGEKFIGLLQRRPDGRSNYTGQDTVSIAKNLKGHLLLAHGSTDDNVPPNLTLLLVDSLIRANKNFDLIILPNEQHLYRGPALAYMTRRRWDYFVRHLLEAEPPHEYEMHMPAEYSSAQEY